MESKVSVLEMERCEKFEEISTLQGELATKEVCWFDIEYWSQCKEKRRACTLVVKK